MHLPALIHDLAVILGVAGLVTLLFQRIRQPVVLGYIIAGIIVGPFTPPFPLVKDLPNIRTWADLGIVFLMFSLGLEFSFRKLARVGISAGITAGFEVSFMLALGFLTAMALGWPSTDGLFLGAMLSISSTTIIIKALDELKLKTRRFAEMIFGVLIVEDLVAILVLVALSTIAGSSSFSTLALLGAAGKLALVVGGWFVTGYFLVPRFVRYVGLHGSDEMLTVVSISLCLALVVFAAHFDYSVALGAFIMGSILAESSESHRIEELIRPLRDVFAAVFFVSVGMLIDPRLLRENLGAVLLISLVTVAGKIVSTTLGALITGQTLRTSVQVGFGLAQIGEFSFIIASLGMALKVTSPALYPIAVAVSIITTFTTPYLIRVSHRAAVALEARLPARLREGLTRYAVWTQGRQANGERRKYFYRALFKWALNGLMVTVIFTLTRDLALPRLPSPDLGWGLAVLVSAPFTWAMLAAFKGFRFEENGPQDAEGEDLVPPSRARAPGGGTLFAFRFASLGWIGLLSAEFFPLRTALTITAAMLFGLSLLFYRRLESSYHWFERRFLSTFEAGDKSSKRTDVLRGLAPWDAHLIRLKVHPNADIVLKRIADSRLRVDFGLNIVAIQRGLRTIVAPRPDEMILPKDELLVLGTDEQVENVRPRIEKPPGLGERFKELSGYEMRSVEVQEGAGLSGKTIRSSGIRETFGAMVVGLERGNRRIINPESDFVLEAGDRLWIVGDKDGLDRLASV